MNIDQQESETGLTTKQCTQCLEIKPLTDFLRRTGKRRGSQGRRGKCRSCRQLPPKISEPAEVLEVVKAEKAEERATPRKRRRRRGKSDKPSPSGATAAGLPNKPSPSGAAIVGLPNKPSPSGAARVGQPPKSSPSGSARGKLPPKPNMTSPEPAPHAILKPTRQGFVRMRGKTDKGRRWYQEVEPELAIILVRESAAVVVNRHTIQRIHSNKEFRSLILTRDNYTCRFCGQYGDTIDHLLPRAKGGHTTPSNCVCACNECNQTKADRDLYEFINSQE